MKKAVFLASLIISTATLFSGCGGNKPEKIDVKEKSLHLEADEKYTVFLSQEYFSTEDIEKIAQYVEK